MKEYKYLIAGGGMTADAAVKGIREKDDKGSIGLITTESDTPYARPPLTKDLWQGKSIDDIWLGTAAKGTEIIQGRSVASVDPDQRTVEDDAGVKYTYQRLLLATGGTPKRLPFDSNSTIYYRTAADYRKLKEMTENGSSFVVFGAGFIGSEIAAALAMNGKEVTMVFPEGGVGGLIFPEKLSGSLNSYYRDKGVNVITSCKPSEIKDQGAACVVRLENSRELRADGIVAGLGITPNTELADSCGLEVQNGIVVDEQLRTARDDIFSAGDAANFYNPLLDARIRVEHEDNALTMGETAGRNMAGADEVYHHLPFFYSDLFDAGYEAVGKISSSYKTITDVKGPEDKGPVFYMEGDRVRGVVFWNIFGKVDAGRELIAAPGPHTEDGLRSWAKERLS
jgi:NADPH-dependent 2,4-dienoyl-CoA reductase/sulfur reductase-like enzyme